MGRDETTNSTSKRRVKYSTNYYNKKTTKKQRLEEGKKKQASITSWMNAETTAERSGTERTPSGNGRTPTVPTNQSPIDETSPQQAGDSQQHTNQQRQQAKYDEQQDRRLYQQRLSDFRGRERQLNEPFGNGLEHKEPTATRFYFQNVNGLYKDIHKWPSIIKAMQENDVDIIGLAETNVHWSTALNAQAKLDLARKTGSRLVRTTSSKIKPKEGQYKPGGTLTAITGKWTGRCSKLQSDETGMGRWTAATIQGQDGTAVSIITAYRVCQGSHTQGHQTAWAQQHAILAESGRHNVDPRAQILVDLATEVQARVNQKQGVVVMIDANESFLKTNGNTTTIAEWAHRQGLVDVHEHLHPGANKIASHITGSQKIDYIFVTPDILQYILAAGATGFLQVITSDHRGIFVDINLHAYLKGEPAIDNSQASRILQSTRPKDVHRYQVKLQEILEEQRISQRVEDLFEQEALSPEQWEELEAIDKAVTEAIVEAEKSVKKKTHAHSNALVQARLKWLIWSTRLTEIRTGREMREQLIKWCDKSEDTKYHEEVERASIKETQQKIRQAQKALRAAKKADKELRKAFLMGRAEAAAMEGNGNVAQAYRAIIKAEESKAVFATIGNALKDQQKSKLTHILVPEGMEAADYPYDPAQVESWESIHDDAKIQEYLKARNVKHFAQAQGTPFTVEPLLSAIGRNADTRQAEEILQGQRPPELDGLSDSVKAILAECKQKLPERTTEYSFDDFKAGIKHWRESTATYGPRHLGTYKALFAPTGEEKQEDDEQTRGEVIATTLWRIMYMAIKEGKPLKRWLNALNVMLEKIPGKPLLNKLRVIHLFEAEYQLFLKDLAWTTSRSAENKVLMGGNQYGSRGGLSAERLLFATSLMQDYIPAGRVNAGLANHDAQACYDRIIARMVALINRTFGCPRNAVALHAEALETMQYTIKTPAGISPTSAYTSTEEQTLHGIGQGTSDGPIQWALISVILGNVLEKEGHGLTLKDPMSVEAEKRLLQSFVDDGDTFTGGKLKDIPVEELVELLRQDAQLWTSLLNASGGRLELEKCFFTVAVWKFDKWGIPSTKPVEEIRGETIITQEGESVQVPLQDCTKGYKTLGQYRALVGQPKEEEERLSNKISKTISKLYNAGLNRAQARTAYDRVFMPGLLYGLGTSPISARRLREIQKPATHGFLPILGVNRHMPREIVYGPRAFGGLGLTDLPTEAGISAVELALQHLRDPSSTEGKMLRICLRQQQMEAGIQAPLLEAPKIALPYIAEGWIVQLREYLASNDHIIWIPTEKHEKPMREHDEFIMDTLRQTVTDKTTLARLNACRLYLQVRRISEIATEDGKYIDPNIMADSPEQYPSKIEWPQQEKPTDPAAWRLFRRHIVAALGTGGTGSSSTKLKKPLGKWVAEFDQLEQVWSHAVHPATGVLYSMTEEGWEARRRSTTERQGRRYTRQNSQAWTYSSTIHGRVDKPPQGCVPTTAKQVGDKLSIQEPKDHYAQQVNASESIDFLSYLQQLGEDTLDHTLMYRTKIFISDNKLEELLQDETEFLHCSDGGAKDGYGSFGWILATKRTETIIAQGKGPVYGDSEHLHSFRSEAFGGAAAAKFISHAFDYFKINRSDRICQWTWLCDNLGLIKRLAKLQSPLCTTAMGTKADADICATLVSSMGQIPNNTAEHIKGHQDETGTALSFKATLNVHADRLATEYLCEFIEPAVKDKAYRYLQQFEQVPAMEECGAQLINMHDPEKPRYITSKVAEQLRHASLTPDMRRYMINKYPNWTGQTPEKVNWLAYKKAQSGIPWGEYVQVVKLANNWADTAERQKQQDQHKSDKCLRCQSVEDAKHILQCNLHTKTKIAYLRQLHKIMEKYRINHEIETAITAGIRQILQLRQEPLIRLTSRTETERRDQGEIGWDRLILGHVSSGWMERQAEWEATLPKLEHPVKQEQWVIQVIQLGWWYVREAWKERNELVHGNDEEARRQKQTILEARVKIAYRDRHLLHENSQRFFNMPEEDRINNHTQKEIEGWLHYVTSLLRTARTEESYRQDQGLQDIRSFFELRATTTRAPEQAPGEETNTAQQNREEIT